MAKEERNDGSPSKNGDAKPVRAKLMVKKGYAVKDAPGGTVLGEVTLATGMTAPTVDKAIAVGAIELR